MRRWVAVAGAIVVLVVLARVLPLADAVEQAAAAVRDAGPFGRVVFAGLYAVATVTLIPASTLTVAAGAAWGPWEALLAVWPGATLGALVAFGLARGAGRQAVAARVGSVPVLAALDDVLESEGGRVTLLLRLSPLVPFGVLNYALGLTRVRFDRYATATAVGILPGTLLYTWIGATAGELGAAATSGAVPTARTALLVVGLAATLAVTVVLSRGARRALEARLERSA